MLQDEILAHHLSTEKELEILTEKMSTESFSLVILKKYVCISVNMCFSLLFYYSYVHTMLGSFLPSAPTPSLTMHIAPSLSLPPPQYPAETVLPLSLILLKREYKK
jgi:hypothetical protein